MIIYKDILTEDELFTDTFKMELVDDIFYKVKGKYVIEKQDAIDASLIGGNASAEGEDEACATEGSSVSGIDVVLSGRLVETGYKNKKEYQVVLKDYVKKILEKLKEEKPERAPEFKSKTMPAIKKFLDKFGDLQFFMGESCDPDAMAIIMEHDGETPYLYFFKDGLIEEKV